MASRLLMVRHACVASAYDGRFVGRTNVPLCDRGQKQAQAIAAAAASWKVSRCFVSPMLRATQTAKPLIDMLNISAQFDEDLREIDFGQWEGMTFCQVQRENSQLVEKWCGNDNSFTFPGGENTASFLERAKRCAKKLASDNAQTVLAVTHGGIIRAVICCLLGLDHSNHVLFDIRPGSLTTIDLFDGKGVLSGLNDLCHLGTAES